MSTLKIQCSDCNSNEKLSFHLPVMFQHLLNPFIKLVISVCQKYYVYYSIKTFSDIKIWAG